MSSEDLVIVGFFLVGMAIFATVAVLLLMDIRNCLRVLILQNSKRRQWVNAEHTVNDN